MTKPNRCTRARRRSSCAFLAQSSPAKDKTELTEAMAIPRTFAVSSPGKIIVFGEHAVVHGRVSRRGRRASG